MASVGNTSESSGNLSSGFSFSHTVAAGSNKVLCVTWHSASGVSLTGITFNTSENLSLVSSTAVTNGETTEIWALVNPTVTTANIVVSHSGGMHHSGAKGIDFSDADTPDNGNTNSPTSTTSSSITVSGAASGDMVLDAIAIGSNPAEGADQTNFLAGSSGGFFFEASHQAGADGGVMSWTFGSDSGAHSACRIPNLAVPAWDQDRYRFGTNDGTESTHGWAAALNTSFFADTDTTYLLRISVQNADSGAAIILKSQYRVNGGTWTDITTTSSNIRAVDGILTDGNDTTDRLGASGTFITTNAYQDETGAVASLTYATGEQCEYLLAFQVRSADLGFADAVEFRLVETDNTVLDTYTNTPLLTVEGVYVTPFFEVPVRIPDAELAMPALEASGCRWMPQMIPRMDAFRFYFDGPEATSTPRAAENVNITVDNTSNVIVQLRYRVQEIGGVDSSDTADWELEVSYNGGAYSNWLQTTSNIQGADGTGEPETSVLGQDVPTTNRAVDGLTDGTGSFTPGETDRNRGRYDNRQLTASDFKESVTAFVLVAADNSPGDTFEFRFTMTGSTTNEAQVENTIVPKITLGTAEDQEIPHMLPMLPVIAPTVAVGY